MGIGKRIKEARENLGLTQAELANLVGVTGSAITNYEKETSHPKEAILYKLFEVLKVDANYIFQDVANISKKTNTITIMELNHIKKYRQLDTHGKYIIDFLLDEEYKRCIGAISSASDISVYEDTEYLKPTTGKGLSESILTKEDLTAIEKALEQPRIKKA